MKNNYRAINIYCIFFFLAVTSVFIFGSIFSYPSGDWLIINELINQKFFFYYNKNLTENYPQILNEGRYHILNGMHLNIAYLVLNLKAKIIFIGILQSITYLYLCYIIHLCIKPRSRLEYVLFISIILSQQFLYPYLHPSLEESIFSLIIALLMYFLVGNNKKYIEIKISLILILLVLAKITSIIIIVGYLVASIINSRLTGIGINRKFSLIFICGALLWYLIASNTGSQITGEDKERFIEFYRYLLLYLKSNPIIFIVILFTLFSYKKSNLIESKESYEFYNFFIVGILYFISLIAAGKHSQYHILPVYVCILPAFFIHYKEFINSIKFSSYGLLLLVLALSLEFFYGNFGIIILNLIIISYIAAINYRKSTSSKILQLVIISNLLIIIIFSYKISFFSGQLIFYSYLIFILIRFKLGIFLSQALSSVLFIYTCLSMLIPGVVASYEHVLNQSSIVGIATQIHNNQQKNTTKNLIIFNLPEAKPEDEINHAYILAKTIKSVYGDSIYIMPYHCGKIPETYESIRIKQSLDAASDFNNVVIPCLQMPISELKNYSTTIINAHSNKFIGEILDRLHVFNPSQLIISSN